MMTLQEVARFLRVSERTVHEWALKGELPAAQIGTSWSFNRDVVEKWVGRHLASQRPGKAVAHPGDVAIADVLAPDRVKLLAASNRRDALLEMIDLIASAPQITDPSALRTEVFHREDLMTTGIGLGIAVPHVQLPSVTDTVLAVGVAPDPIPDYQSPDGLGVSIICMIAAPQAQHARYIHTLAAVSTRLRDDAVRTAVLHAPDVPSIYAILVG